MNRHASTIDRSNDDRMATAAPFSSTLHKSDSFGTTGPSLTSDRLMFNFRLAIERRRSTQ